MDTFLYTSFAFKILPFLAALILYSAMTHIYLCFSFKINSPLNTQGVKYIFFLGNQDIQFENYFENRSWLSLKCYI